VVDETADVADAAAAIMTAKTFDYATSCLADNAVVAHTDVYDELLRRLTGAGAHLCDQQQKDALGALMWPDGGAVPAIAVVAKSAAHIADLAGFGVDPGCPMLLVEEQGTGPDHPFSGEKLSVVLAVYRYQGDIAAAADLVNAITGYQGLGHTCGIHRERQRAALRQPDLGVQADRAEGDQRGGPLRRALAGLRPVAVRRGWPGTRPVRGSTGCR